MKKIMALVLSLSFGTLSAAVLDTNFTQNTFYNASPFTNGVTSLTWAPDGSNRLFVTVKNYSGPVYIIDDSVLVATPFCTLNPYYSSECGVLSLAFDPNYASNKYVYIFYTQSSSKQKIVRFTDSSNVGIDSVTIVDNLPTTGNNHDGGGISIGPDGKIYWAIGDLGGGTGVDNDTTTLASKVGRANLDGSPVNDNPYYNTGNGITATDYIWARGFRNPFTHTWNSSTNKLWLNVVGTSYEQIFVVDNGDHGGWNNYEGGNQPSGYIQPVFTYSTNGGHGLGGCITGGTFYDATAFPAAYQGNFFFGDYNSGKVIRLVFDGSNVLTDSATFVTGISNVVDVNVGPDGALYYASHGNGNIYRLTYKAATQSITLSGTSVAITEGNGNTFTVRLAIAPSSDMTVYIALSSGSSDITSSHDSLTFTTSDWSTPQTVTLSAAEDADVSPDTAVFSVSNSMLSARTVTAVASDNDVQSFVLSAAYLNLTEGDSGTFTVALAYQPASSVTVNVARDTGDVSIAVTGGGTLNFSTSDWATPQTVTVVAMEDGDAADAAAGVAVTASGVTKRTVLVTAVDNDASAPVITTTNPDTTAVVGIPYTFDFDATGSPAPSFFLINPPSGMTIESSSGLISWPLPSQGQVNVTVVADNGVAPEDTLSYALIISNDLPPTASITLPQEGDTVKGLTTEWYGDGQDDGGTVKAEFYIDSVLVFTDSAIGGHYHVNGTHNQWNTTLLANGPHQLMMVVYDAINQTGSAVRNVVVDNPSTALSLTSRLPDRFALSQNIPNPFTPATVIRYDLPLFAKRSLSLRTRVSLAVYNLRGQLIRQLVDRAAEPGRYNVSWDGRDASRRAVSNGMYFYRIVVLDAKGGVKFTAMRKMVRIR